MPAAPKQFTSVVHTSPTHGPVLVRAVAGWMDDAAVRAYLDGVSAGHLDEETHVLFARIALYEDVGDADGGWVSAYRRNGDWDLSEGGRHGV